MQLQGLWCGKCDQVDMIEEVEAAIAGNHLCDFPENCKLPYCYYCGTQVDVLSAEGYYAGAINEIPSHLGEAIDNLNTSIHWWRNREYVKSRLLICQEELRYQMTSALDLDADKTVYRWDSMAGYELEKGSYGLNCHAYRIHIVAKAIFDLLDLLQKYEDFEDTREETDLPVASESYMKFFGKEYTKNMFGR